MLLNTSWIPKHCIPQSEAEIPNLRLCLQMTDKVGCVFIVYTNGILMLEEHEEVYFDFQDPCFDLTILSYLVIYWCCLHFRLQTEDFHQM